MAVEPLLSDAEAAASVCILETVGRVSGEPRRIEIWFAAEGNTAFLLAGDRERAHWVRNLRADPAARLEIRGRWLDGTAREVEGTPEEQRVREALAAKYQGWVPGRPLSAWARTALPVAIDLSK